MELAAQDERIFLLCGDLGFSVLENFATRFPERFINIGVAEQNMTGVAAGLALSGKIVFTYSIANFPVIRCLEQVRNDVCYHNANVKIVAVGGGYAYGPQGYTHHGVEDLAAMLLMPNMTVVAPGDPAETRLATRALVQHPGPCFLRLGKAKEPVVHQEDPKFEIGKAIELRNGRQITIITTGAVLEVAARAADLLKQQRVKVRLLSMPTLRPLDVAAIEKAARETSAILTIEEHGAGGLRSEVSTIFATGRFRCALASIWARSGPASVAGSQEYFRKQMSLTPEGIVEAAKALLKSKKRLPHA